MVLGSGELPYRESALIGRSHRASFGGGGYRSGQDSFQFGETAVVVGDGVVLFFLVAVELALGFDETQEVNPPGDVACPSRFEIVFGGRYDALSVEINDSVAFVDSLKCGMDFVLNLIEELLELSALASDSSDCLPDRCAAALELDWQVEVEPDHRP